MINGVILHQQINIFKLHSLESLCDELNLRLVPIRPEDRSTPLGILAGSPDAGPEKKNLPSTEFSPEPREMLVLCGLTPELLDRFLTEFRKREIPPIELKAVLTSHNVSWTPGKLQTELIKESRAFSR
ncbi:MAG: DUF3783 domain-containing protein [Parasporobacterium sp.]|nr:DUF3783 domain-containing protein [Parasporobacterium sp.]